MPIRYFGTERTKVEFRGELEESHQLAGSSSGKEFVFNQRYTERIAELVTHARGSFKATNEPAYRLLQILTHLRGKLRV